MMYDVRLKKCEHSCNTMKYHGKVKQWFFTYPKSGEETKETFMNKLPPIDYGIFCLEHHQDGSNHLHGAIKLKHGLSKAQLRRYVEDKFPDSCQRMDYKPIRSFTHSIDYCKKEDPKVLEIGTLDKKKKPRGASEKNQEAEQDALKYQASIEFVDSIWDLDHVDPSLLSKQDLNKLIFKE